MADDALSCADVGGKSKGRRLDTPENRERIETTLAELRPAFQRDGGDCELVAVESDRVLVRLTGACVGCHLSSATMQGIQAALTRALNQLVRVIPVPGAPRVARPFAPTAPEGAR